jgi:hypothetical protein
MALAEPWHVRSRSRICSATQRPFVNEERIITALFPDPETGGYLRHDYSLESWENREATESLPFSFWKTTYTINLKEENPSSSAKLSAEEILKHLLEKNLDHTQNARFILAVMLERQKILKETSNQLTDQGILRVYEHRKSGEVFIVRDPNIPLREIEAVQKEVFDLLENNGRTPTREQDIEPTEEPTLPTESL